MRKHIWFLIICILAVLIFILPFLTSTIKQYNRLYYGIPKGVQIGNINISGYYPQEVRNLLLKEGLNLVCWPESASLSHNGVITQEKWGKILDLPATMARLESAKEGDIIDPVFVFITPSLTSKEILSVTRSLGVFDTFIGGTKDRYHNIELAGKLINFTLILPEEVFSFNQSVGSPVKERGFLRAPIIVDNELVPGYGGGICQLSSTLYNAALKAQLKIIERHSHSKKVNYVPPGKDATVAYDYLDFKFINSLNYPILIRVWVEGNRLKVGIFGSDV
ncbi:MAG: VanW family protein [Halanaerobiales bacterium]|nr:VanW family protein [Halanaerobiales bacterium]